MRLLKLTDEQYSDLNRYLKLIGGQEAMALHDQLDKLEPTFAECSSYFGAKQKREEPELNPYRDAAEGADFDDDAIVSKGKDNGAYVMAWIWVSDEDAGIEHCDKCDAVLPEAGDGYDGLCADCADAVHSQA